MTESERNEAELSRNFAFIKTNGPDRYPVGNKCYCGSSKRVTSLTR
jgi:hypothetical protein